MNNESLIINLMSKFLELEKKVGELEGKISVLEEKVSNYETNSDSKNKNEKTVPDNVSKKKDKTKYLFDANLFFKNRLVLNVVKKYVSEHPNITFEELRNIFGDKLQGSFGVVRERKNISEKNKIRYFIDDKNQTDSGLIILSDGTEVAVSNQWGKENIKTFIILARSLGYEIIELQ